MLYDIEKFYMEGKDMEEKQKNEQKTEFKGNLGFIWLVGILVIFLGCTIGYVLN